MPWFLSQEAPLPRLFPLLKNLSHPPHSCVGLRLPCSSSHLAHHYLFSEGFQGPIRKFPLPPLWRCGPVPHGLRALKRQN